MKRTLISTEKTGSVNDDIVAGKFTKEKLFNKRSAKQKLLPTEVFDPPEEPVFKQNKTGFLTERPLEWMVAMEKYVSVEKDVKARWVYKTDEDGTIYECEISTWFHTTTEVTVVIVVSTGVFTVQGQHCRKFAETEFIKILDHMKDCEILSPPKEPTKKTDLDEKPDLEGMWKNIDSNKNALLSVQESIVKLFDIIKETDVKRTQENEIRDSTVYIERVEKKLDDKLTIRLRRRSRRYVKDSTINLIK